jgi:hypothetical protein
MANQSDFSMPAELTPTQQLSRLRVIVEHLLDGWRVVLRRRTYLQAMARREDLREALEQTYAAHAHNALQDVLLIDQLREIGALVLDTDRRSASVAQAVTALRQETVLAELRAEYGVVLPPPRVYNEHELTPAMRAAVDETLYNSELARNLGEFDCLRAEVDAIERDVLRSDVARLLAQARNKAVAHYDVVRDGSDWRLWRIGDTRLTYGQLDEYVEAVTSAIDNLNLFVRRAAFDFGRMGEIAQEQIKEYLDALVHGLRHQREQEQERLEDLRRRAAAIEAGSAEQS